MPIIGIAFYDIVFIVLIIFLPQYIKSKYKPSVKNLDRRRAGSGSAVFLSICYLKITMKKPCR